MTILLDPTALRPPDAQERDLLAPILDLHNVAEEAVSDIYARVVWCCLAEPGDGVAGALIAQYGARGALERVASSGPDDLPELRAGRKRWAPRWQPRFAEETLRAASFNKLKLLTPQSAHWPPGVDDLGPHAPACLWVRGDPRQLTSVRPSVAIVGARAATSYGEHVAGELAGALVAAGVTVVSGAAYGIDGAAHRSALSMGGATVALLAGGVDRAYPQGHTSLLQRIAETGAVVSEVPCGSAPTRWRFLMRNRLIAAMSSATVVVEAGWRSGSLNTAGHAASLARGLGAVPGPITSSTSSGCHRLLREYDATCITSADDVLEMLGLGSAAVQASPEHRTDSRSRVLDALAATPRSALGVAQRCGMGVTETEAQLGFLELEGAVANGPSGWRLIPKRR